ncbi:MAG: TonB-dependent receptor [Pseudomonadota bacterium]|jgi:outer membrane receptor protein involved in Fe transport
MVGKKDRFLFCTAALAALLAPGIAIAQDAGDAPHESDIIVTAQRREQSVIDVPLTVNVLSAADLTKRGVTSLQDIAQNVPGLDVFSQGGGKQLIQIRGINSLRGTSSLVGIYLDETPLTGSQDGFYPVYADAGALDLARVEVLKGPQGTLFGEGAMSGVIRYVTNDPRLDRIGGNIESSIFATDGGSVSGQAKAALNVPLSSTLAVRFAGEYQNNGGWLDNVGTGARNVNSNRIYDGRVKLLWQPDPRLRIVGMVDIRHNDEDSPSYANVLPYEKGFYRHAIDPNGRTSGVSELDLYSLRAEYDLGFAELMSNTAHSRRYSNSNLDQIYYATDDPAAPITLEIANTRYLNKQSITSQELRLTSKGDGPFKWVVGGIYKDDDLLRHFLDGAELLYPPSTTVTILQEPIRTTSKSWAVYGDASYSPIRRLEIGGGLRYSHDTRTFTDGDLPTASGTFARVTYRAFVKYDIARDANLYFNVGNGFRSGGFNAVVNPAFPPPLTYAPERSMAYEAGFKASMLNGKLGVNVAAFQQYYRGQVYDRVVLTPVFLQYTANGGNTRIRGVEWQLTANPVRALRLSASGTVMGSVFVASTPDAEVDFPPGTSPLALPKYSIQLSANYAFDWASSVPGYFDIDFNHKDKLVGGQGVTRIVTGPQSFLGASLGATVEGLDIAIFVRNLLNEHSPYYPTLGGIGAVPRPRQIGIRLGKSF